MNCIFIIYSSERLNSNWKCGKDNNRNWFILVILTLPNQLPWILIFIALRTINNATPTLDNIEYPRQSYKNSFGNRFSMTIRIYKFSGTDKDEKSWFTRNQESTPAYRCSLKPLTCNRSLSTLEGWFLSLKKIQIKIISTRLFTKFNL